MGEIEIRSIDWFSDEGLRLWVKAEPVHRRYMAFSVLVSASHYIIECTGLDVEKAALRGSGSTDTSNIDGVMEAIEEWVREEGLLLLWEREAAKCRAYLSGVDLLPTDTVVPTVEAVDKALSELPAPLLSVRTSPEGQQFLGSTKARNHTLECVLQAGRVLAFGVLLRDLLIAKGYNASIACHVDLGQPYVAVEPYTHTYQGIPRCIAILYTMRDWREENLLYTINALHLSKKLSDRPDGIEGCGWQTVGSSTAALLDVLPKALELYKSNAIPLGMGIRDGW